MTDDLLTTCVNCSHRISRGAHSCPHCNFECLNCRLCRLPIRNEHLVQKSFNYKKYAPFHRECLARYFQVPADVCCPDCNIPLSGTTLGKRIADLAEYISPPCPNCGAANPLRVMDSPCGGLNRFGDVCGLAIILAFQRKSSYGHYHEFCGPVHSPSTTMDSYRADKTLADIVLAIMFGLMAGVPTFVATIIIGLVIGIPVSRIPCLFLFAPAILAGGIAAFMMHNKRRHEY